MLLSATSPSSASATACCCSKDATIREIHHRVKNNLQTISSLLRLQARRLTNPEAKAAVAESVRRIRTIALVHESLSREPGDDVTFIEIVRPLLRLAEESLQSPDRPVRVHACTATAGASRPASPRRCRSCSPSCCRTPSITASPRAAAAARCVVVSSHNDGERAGGRRHRRRRGARSDSASRRRPGSACRSCARSSPPSSTARSRCDRRTDGPRSASGSSPTAPIAGHAGADGRTARRDRLESPELSDVSWRVEAADAARRPAGGALAADHAALLFGECRPRCRSPGWWRARTRGTPTCTAHSPHTCLARSICSSAVPVVPTGKNSSGSVSRHRACSRHVSVGGSESEARQQGSTRIVLLDRGTGSGWHDVTWRCAACRAGRRRGTLRGAVGREVRSSGCSRSTSGERLRT